MNTNKNTLLIVAAAVILLILSLLIAFVSRPPASSVNTRRTDSPVTAPSAPTDTDNVTYHVRKEKTLRSGLNTDELSNLDAFISQLPISQEGFDVAYDSQLKKIIVSYDSQGEQYAFLQLLSAYQLEEVFRQKGTLLFYTTTSSISEAKRDLRDSYELEKEY